MNVPHAQRATFGEAVEAALERAAQLGAVLER